MEIGINTFLFASPFTNESVHLFPKFKSWGFDFVEIALEDPAHIDAAFVKVELEKNGLTCLSVCAAMGPGRDLRGTIAEQQTALAYLTGVMEVMVDLSCKMLVGPLYSAVGRAEQVGPEEKDKQWQTVVQHLKTLSRYAGERSITLAIEPLNRFETDFINTCAQGLRMIQEVNHPSLLLHLDSFHMNIEEKYPDQAIMQAGTYLGHFHACGSDRGTPGNDHTEWKGIFQALKEINYKGNIVIESFTTDVKVIAKAAAIWRQIEPSAAMIAEKGAAFLRGQMAEAE